MSWNIWKIIRYPLLVLWILVHLPFLLIAFTLDWLLFLLLRFIILLEKADNAILFIPRLTYKPFVLYNNEVKIRKGAGNENKLV